jgi:hypothetical protein
MALKPTTIRFTPDAMALVHRAARRQGCSVSQFVREAAIMRASMSGDGNPYPVSDLAAEMRRLGEEGARMIERARRVAEDEAALRAGRGRTPVPG